MAAVLEDTAGTAAAAAGALGARGARAAAGLLGFGACADSAADSSYLNVLWVMTIQQSS